MRNKSYEDHMAKAMTEHRRFKVNPTYKNSSRGINS